MSNNVKNENSSQGEYHGPQVIINNTIVPQIPQRRKKNKLGTAGFVFAILSIVLVWVPVVGWIMWLLGFLFSFIGIFRKSNVLAIIGLVLTSTWIIVGIVIISIYGTGIIMSGIYALKNTF